MPRRIPVTTLNASTIDILNVIRQNASQEYQSLVPVVEKATDIPKVGEVLFDSPACKNEFLNALINRIALVRAKSATFNNPYVGLKKGYLEFGETVEEVFVNLAKAREFNVEKAKDREFRRTIPDVRSAFHMMNIKLQYPVTIEDEQLKRAFLSANGVSELITSIIQSVYTALEYDEFLLFKYMLIKGVAHGKMYPIAVDGSDIKNAAVAFRGTSNRLEFINTMYNESGVHTSTKKSDQVIFMSADFNAMYDVNVLASAFNMDKADFMGNLHLIDDFTTFDNERFDIIREESDGLEEVTADELTLMGGVIAITVDREWFQFYDNLLRFTDVYVANGLYRNYFLNAWKTISYSPFSNAIVFATSQFTATPASFTMLVGDVSLSDTAMVASLIVDDSDVGLTRTDVSLVQSQSAVEAGVAIQRYGAIIIPASAFYASGDGFHDYLYAEVNGVQFKSTTQVDNTELTVGAEIEFEPVV